MQIKILIRALFVLHKKASHKARLFQNWEKLYCAAPKELLVLHFDKDMNLNHL